MKTGCNNINDLGVNHDRYYYVRRFKCCMAVSVNVFFCRLTLQQYHQVLVTLLIMVAGTIV